jgi:hypothetical protein
MAFASGATVVILQSHPVWVAAQQRAHDRSEAMRRHPASLARKIAAAQGGNEVSTRDDSLVLVRH